jgi:hypothetical protein
MGIQNGDTVKILDYEFVWFYSWILVSIRRIFKNVE